MANEVHLKIFRKGVEAWNKWRAKHPHIIPDLSSFDQVYNIDFCHVRFIDFAQFNLAGARLNNADLSGANFQGANLQGASLIEVNLNEANLEGANLIETNLNKADLERANLKYSDLSRANLSEADLSDTDLSEAILCKAILRSVNFTAANLDGADLNCANLSKANLSYASLISTDLSGASLVEANLKNAEFGITKVSGANFRKAILTQEKDDLIGFLGLCFSEGLEAATFSDADFLQDYLAKAFEYAHQPDIRKKLGFSDFLDDAISHIAAMRTFYVDQQQPKQLIEVVSVITSELIHYLKKHPKAMYQIKPRQFEELIAEILASYGWQIQLTPTIKDGGYDIFAIAKAIKPGLETSWIIECKKYAPENKIGVDFVRALYGIKSDLKVANALLATTSHFTKGAKDFKASRYDIELKDYHNILEWINEYRPNPDGELYIKNNQLIVPGED